MCHAAAEMYPLPLYPPRGPVKLVKEDNGTFEADQRKFSKRRHNLAECRDVSQQTFVPLKVARVADTVTNTAGGVSSMRGQVQRSSCAPPVSDSPSSRLPRMNSTATVSNIKQSSPSAARSCTPAATDSQHMHEGSRGFMRDPLMSAATLVQRVDSLCTTEVHAPIYFLGALRVVTSSSHLRTTAAKYATASTSTSDLSRLKSNFNEIAVGTKQFDAALDILQSDEFQQVSHMWTDPSAKPVDSAGAAPGTGAGTAARCSTAAADLGLEDSLSGVGEAPKVKMLPGSELLQLDVRVKIHHDPWVSTHTTECMRMSLRAKICMAQQQILKEKKHPRRLRSNAAVAGGRPQVLWRQSGTTSAQDVDAAQAAIQDGGARHDRQVEATLQHNQQCAAFESISNSVLVGTAMVARGKLAYSVGEGAVNQPKQHSGEQQDVPEGEQQAVQGATEGACSRQQWMFPGAAQQNAAEVHGSTLLGKRSSKDSLDADPNVGACVQSKADAYVDMPVVAEGRVESDLSVAEAGSYKLKECTRKGEGEQPATFTDPVASERTAVAESEQHSSMKGSTRPCTSLAKEDVQTQDSDTPIKDADLLAEPHNAAASVAAASGRAPGGVRTRQGVADQESAAAVAEDANGGSNECCILERTWKTSARGVKAADLGDGDSTTQMRLYDDFVKKALHAASRKKKKVNLEQVKWSKLLRQRQRALCVKETFRPYSFIASIRKIPSRKTCAGTSIGPSQHPCTAHYHNAAEIVLQAKDLAGCCSSRSKDVAGEKRKRLSEAEMPGMHYRSQVDPGAPPHTFAVAMNYLVSRAIDNETISKKTLELPAKIAKLLAVRVTHTCHATLRAWHVPNFIHDTLPATRLRLWVVSGFAICTWNSGMHPRCFQLTGVCNKTTEYCFSSPGCVLQHVRTCLYTFR